MRRMETDMPRRTETDRIMWFSMWFLASIATFGLAFFPMFYYSIERRNKHFLRQAELEKRVRTFFKDEGKEMQQSFLPERNAGLWTISIILVLPVFVIAYCLSEDLLLHEKHQQSFLTTWFPEREYMPQNIAVRKYALVTLATLGVGIVYWLYEILNIYNNHFKEQRKIEDEITKLMEEKGYGESL
jgi:NADH:ubiquinone oxidoreductase subunit 5 (subunit L)/multisubunit Na+/H+ antiporter MnhA subunit